MIFNVNVPYAMLRERINDPLARVINPEIYFSWKDLEEAGEDAEFVAKKLKSWGRRVTFHAPFMDINIGAVDPLVRDVTLKRILGVTPFVEIFDPEVVVIHGGYDPVRYDFDPSVWLDAAKRSVESILKGFDGKVVVAVENVFDRDPHPLWSLFDYFRDEKIGFCFDPGHAFFLGNVPMTYWLDVLGEFLVEVHLHDNHGLSDEHLPLGKGSIDYPTIFRRLRSLKREIVYTLEVHREEDLDEAMKSFERLWDESGK